MKRGSVVRIGLRMASAFAAAALLVFAMPQGWLRVAGALAAKITEAGCPYLTEMEARTEGMIVFAGGKIRLDMTLKDGSPLPLTPASWHKHGGQTLNMLIIAAAIWAAPAVGLRRRLLALPVVLLAAALVSGFDLAVEIQNAALRTIGYEWASGLPLAGTAANLEVFHGLEDWYRGVRGVKAFNDGGGRLFLGVFAGLIGYALPLRRPGAPASAREEAPTAVPAPEFS